MMIIGAAGGHEILASLYYDAGHIDAIELNPVTHDLVDGRATPTTRATSPSSPASNYVHGDGRSFLDRTRRRVRPHLVPGARQLRGHQRGDAGAFVLSESYLYTTETIKESLEHLPPDGILAAQFGEVELRQQAEPHRPLREHRPRRRSSEMGIDDPSAAHRGAHVADDQGSAFRNVDDPGEEDAVHRRRRSPRIADQIGAVEGASCEYAPGRPAATPTRSAQIAHAARRRARRTGTTSTGTTCADHRRRAVLLALRPLRRRRRATSATRSTGVDPEDGTGERVLLLLLASRSCFGRGVPAAAVRRHPRRSGRSCPRKGTLGALLRGARASGSCSSRSP